MKPKISVILPVANAQEFLNITIDSVLRQTYKDFELIVIDCASTDSTMPIVKNYEDARIKYLRQNSSSIEQGRLAGIAASSGKFIALMSQDDVCESGRLASQVSFLQSHPGIDLVGCNFELIDADSRVYDDKPRKINFLKRNPMVAETAMFRADIKDLAGGKFDFDSWWTRIDEYKITLLPEVLYMQRLVRLNPKKTADLNLWLSIAATYPDAAKRQNDLSQANINGVNKLITICNQTWEKHDLTSAQKMLLEQFGDDLQVKWNTLMDRQSTPPKISIVMSMYNSQEFLREAVDSMLKQTVSDYEYIIIDDGCQDRSIDIIRSYNDPRMRIIHQPNHGLVYSFNKGVRLARAEFIARMDADDIALPSRFKKELEWLEQDQRRGMVSSFFQYIDAKTSKRTDIVMAYPYKHTDLFRSMYIVNPIGHGSVMMRKAAVDGVGGYRSEYEPAEDYDLWRRIAGKWQIGLVPEILYLWRFHPGSISRRKQDASNAAAAKTVKNMWSQPDVFKSALAIVKDARLYKHFHPKLSKVVYEHYSSQTERLAIDFLLRRRLWAGWNAAVGSILLNRDSFKRLRRPMAASILKYNKGIK